MSSSDRANAYFPLFIPETAGLHEAEHVEASRRRSPVTHGGGGLEERRPSDVEAVVTMPMGAVLARSADLINQWANIVRWEGDAALPPDHGVSLAGRHTAHETHVRPKPRR
jgi:prolyl-tRNA synthetase